VRCIPRERFERLPSLPTPRSNDAYEELTFAPGLFRAYAPASTTKQEIFIHRVADRLAPAVLLGVE